MWFSYSRLFPKDAPEKAFCKFSSPVNWRIWGWLWFTWRYIIYPSFQLDLQASLSIPTPVKGASCFAPKTHHPLFLSYGRKWPEGLNVSEKWNVQLPMLTSCISKNPILRTIVTSVVLDHGGKPLPKLVFFWHWICCRLKTPENDDFCKQVAGCINHFWRFTVWLNTAKVARTQSS